MNCTIKLRCVHVVAFFMVWSLAISCIPEPLEISDVPVLDSRIVVSSQLIPGQSVAVLLTRSIGALEASDDSDPQLLLDQITVNDAVAAIRSDAGTDTLQFLGNGVYAAAGIDLRINNAYTLLVNSPTLGRVEATTRVMPFIRFDAVSTNLYQIGRDTLAQVIYSVVDPHGTNWYMLNAQHLSATNLEQRLLNPQLTTELFSDKSFEGKKREDQFKVFSRDFKPGDTLAVFLSNINEDYYNFMKIRLDTRFGIADFIGEPINYPSNVQGGLGFFNLYLPDVRIFILE